MNYIQLDNFNGSLNIICKDDGSGETLVFDTLKEAQDTLEENCQDGVIMPLGVNIIAVISELANFRSDILTEEGEDNFDDTEYLNNLVDNILGLKS